MVLKIVQIKPIFVFHNKIPASYNLIYFTYTTNSKLVSRDLRKINQFLKFSNVTDTTDISNAL